MERVMAPMSPCVESASLKETRRSSDAIVTIPMYASKHDPGARVALWRFRGNATAVEWSRHLADMDTVATWSAETPRACVLIDVRDFTPTATQRSDLAAHSEQPGYQPIIAFVSTGGLLRGVLRAIGWMQGSRRYETEFFADAPSALVWLESKSQRSLPRLRKLHSHTDEVGVGTRRV